MPIPVCGCQGQDTTSQVSGLPAISCAWDLGEGPGRVRKLTQGLGWSLQFASGRNEERGELWAKKKKKVAVRCRVWCWLPLAQGGGQDETTRRPEAGRSASSALDLPTSVVTPHTGPICNPTRNQQILPK